MATKKAASDKPKSSSRSIWKGAISFGLVHVPVSLHSATSEQEVDFDWLDKRTMDPVGYKRINKRTGKEIDKDTIVVGHWLKRHRLSAIVERIVDLRASSPAVAEHAHQDRLQSAVAWYLRTRPLLSTAHEQCLKDSLTLIRFLASERLYPQWVIGVRTRPFAAHSWVQEGSLVLNDVHETVRRYTPILVV